MIDCQDLRESRKKDYDGFQRWVGRSVEIVSAYSRTVGEFEG